MVLNFNNTTFNVAVNDNSYRYRRVMGENSLTLYFSLAEWLEFPRGTWCEFEGARYTLRRPATFKKNGVRNFEFTLILDSAQGDLSGVKMKDTTTGRLKFSLTARPHEHLKMLVDSMNAHGSGWTVGECIDNAEKYISYNHAYCNAALAQIAEEFDTEWEVVGKTIYLRKVEYFKDNPLPLSYGKGNGFKPGTGRANEGNKQAIEILYAQGGDRNINPTEYGAAELLLPKSNGLTYEGRIYISDENGLSIRRADKTLLTFIEDSIDCAHIYPSRVGTVSSVVVVDAEKHFYDFIDSSIPADLNFEQCLIQGETLTVIFQSGMLAGKEFEVKYKHVEKKFEIVSQELDGRTMPDDAFKPIAGDKYAVFGISLPEAYVCENSTKTGASWDMFREAAKYLYEHEESPFTFTGELDGTWAAQDWLNIGGRIKLGAFILFTDPQYQPAGIPIRVVAVKDYINRPHYPDIELSNSIAGSGVATSLGKIDSNDATMEEMYRGALLFTKRRFRDAQETIDMLEEALLNGYTDRISPIAVQTMSLLVGDQSLQFRFVNSMVTPTTVSHQVTYNAATKVLSLEAGILQHMTLGITSITQHKPSEYKYWTIPSFNTPPLTEPGKRYYLYAKVSKINTTGVFYISETAIAIEAVDSYYHLLLGVLNSEFGNDRSYASFYGFTEVLPGRINTNKIVSNDGQTYFDLLLGEIGGKIKFKNNAGEYENVADISPDNGAIYVCGQRAFDMWNLNLDFKSDIDLNIFSTIELVLSNGSRLTLHFNPHDDIPTVAPIPMGVTVNGMYVMPDSFDPMTIHINAGSVLQPDLIDVTVYSQQEQEVVFSPPIKQSDNDTITITFT